MKKECAICGKKFTRLAGNEKTCSVECKRIYKKKYRTEYREKYEERVQIGSKISCIICGNEFVKEKKNQKTCSEKCKILRERQVNRESFHRRDREEYNKKRREYKARKKASDNSDIKVKICYDVVCDKCNRRLSDFTKIKQFSKQVTIEHAKFNGWIYKKDTNENICPVCLKEGR